MPKAQSVTPGREVVQAAGRFVSRPIHGTPADSKVLEFHKRKSNPGGIVDMIADELIELQEKYAALEAEFREHLAKCKGAGHART